MTRAGRHVIIEEATCSRAVYRNDPTIRRLLAGSGLFIYTVGKVLQKLTAQKSVLYLSTITSYHVNITKTITI